MYKKIFLVLAFLVLLLPLSGFAYEMDYAGMITKYGPVPDAILEPPADEIIAAEKRSLFSNFFSGRSRSRGEARANACYANQRVTLGAIEMYNMDNTVMYTTLSDHDVSDRSGLLVTSKYLKSAIHKAEPGCRLRSYGDLSDTGIIYCDYHGCVPSDRDSLRAAAGYIAKAPAAGTRSTAMLVVLVVLGVFSVGVMIVLHNVLPKKQDS